MIVHWEDLAQFSSKSKSPAVRELYALINGESGMLIKVSLLSMSACWTLALEDFWRQDWEIIIIKFSLGVFPINVGHQSG